MKKKWRAFITFVLVACLIFITNLLAYSQENAIPESKFDGAPVVFNHETLFVIREKLGLGSPQQRAREISGRIERFAQDFSLPLDSLQIAEAEGIAVVYSGETALVGITAADAKAAGTTQQQLAAEYIQKIRTSIGQYRKEHSLKHLIFAIIYTVISTVIFIITLAIFNNIFPRIITQIYAWENTRIRGFRIQNFELLSSHQIARFLSRLSKITRWLVTFVIFLIYIALVLSFFTWTKILGQDIFSEFKKAIAFVWDKFIGYLPNLFILALIIVITYYIIRLLKPIFNALERGHISLPGFYSEWAEPTYNLLVFLLLALAAVVAFPYLPGSDAPAFKGISILLGILLSLGSTAAVANIVSGFILIYTRAFRIGDLVNVAETEGFIEEKLLLVTRIRTHNNNLVTIPNSLLIANKVINYSAALRDHNTPLLLHTSVTLGYDAPWRKVYQAFIDAALSTSYILEDPAPFVLQTSLNDFYVTYELKAYTNQPAMMPKIYSELHENIQDKCNEAGIEIMSPHYSAIRDGNQTTIPENYLPKDYTSPGFRLSPLSHLFNSTNQPKNSEEHE
jgi:small-conductance mechanosensitive channel